MDLCALCSSFPLKLESTGNSEPFALYRSTRQVCHLSPLLFALALEPLAACIRALPDVGFLRGSRTDVISIYANNTLIYLRHTQGTMQVVMAHIDNFGALSGFSINWNRSVLMPQTLFF